jgi:hypothetical protein
MLEMEKTLRSKTGVSAGSVVEPSMGQRVHVEEVSVLCLEKVGVVFSDTMKIRLQADTKRR